MAYLCKYCLSDVPDQHLLGCYQSLRSSPLQPTSTPTSPTTPSLSPGDATRLLDLLSRAENLLSQIGTLRSECLQLVQTVTGTPITGRADILDTLTEKHRRDLRAAESLVQQPAPSSPASTPPAAKGVRLRDELQAPFSWGEYVLALTALGFRPTREAYRKYINLATRMAKEASRPSRKGTRGAGARSSSKQKVKTISRRSN